MSIGSTFNEEGFDFSPFKNRRPPARANIDTVMGLKHLFITLAAAEIFRLTKATLTAPNALTLQITKNTTHAIPSTLYGYMWEVSVASPNVSLYIHTYHVVARTLIIGAGAQVTKTLTSF